MNALILIEDRREPDANIAPLIERRTTPPQRVPRWLQRARDGALYGYDKDGKPVAKDMSVVSDNGGAA
jgi:hypothetical protein